MQKSKFSGFIFFSIFFISLAAESLAQTAEWAQIIRHNSPIGLCIDDDGYIYAATSGQAGWPVGPDSIPSLYGPALIKFNSDGTVVWMANIPLYPKEIEVDHKGNIYLAGGEHLAKMDKAGNLIWNTSSTLSWRALSLDNTGNCIVGGLCEYGPSLYPYSIDINGTHGTSISFPTGTTYETEGVMAKYDSTGRVIWAKINKGSSSGWIEGIACDRFGNIYTAGLFKDTLFFSGSYLFSGGGSITNGVVAKYDTDANLLWTQQISCTIRAVASAISVNSLDQVAVCGFFKPSCTIAGSTISSTSTGLNSFVAAFDLNGSLSWLHGIHCNQECSLENISSDQNGNLFASGYFDKNVFDSDDISLFADSTDQTNGFVVCLDENGFGKFGYQVSGLGSQGITQTFAHNGMAYMTGVYNYQSVFQTSGGIVTYTDGDSNSEFFIAKIIYPFTSTSTPELPIKTNFESYPNPLTDVLSLTYSSSINSSCSLSIVNTLGETVYYKEYSNCNNIPRTISLNELENGIYFLSILQENKRTVKKLVKQ